MFSEQCTMQTIANSKRNRIHTWVLGELRLSNFMHFLNLFHVRVMSEITGELQN
jgi:hypothetical protein